MVKKQSRQSILEQINKLNEDLKEIDRQDSMKITKMIMKCGLNRINISEKDLYNELCAIVEKYKGKDEGKRAVKTEPS